MTEPATNLEPATKTLRRRRTAEDLLRGLSRLVHFASGGAANKPLPGLSDARVRRIAKRGGRLDFFWRIWSRMAEPSFTMSAAGVAFYAFLAIFPAIACFVSVYGLITDPVLLQAQTDAIERFLPPVAAKLISNALRGFLAKGAFELNAALAISFLFTLWSARAGVSALMSALNIVFEVEEQRSFLAQQVVAVALTIAAIVVGIAVLLATSVVPAVLALLPPEKYSQSMILWLRWPILAVLVAVGFACIYRFGPCRPKARWRVTYGATGATVLWLTGSSLFSLYITMFGAYDAIYGSLAAVVVMLMWLWVTALALLTGAVIDAERARTTA